MKRYKTWEVIKMLTENPKLRFKDKTGIILESNLGFNSVCGEFKLGTGLIMDLDTDWQLIQESVSFEEVLNSDKKCRVEHEYINEIDCGKVEKDITRLLYKEYYNEFLETLNKIKNNNYMYFNQIMSILSWVFTHEELKEVIKNGKWYLE